MSTFKRQQSNKLYKKAAAPNGLSLEQRDVLYDLDPDIFRVIFKDMEYMVQQYEAAIVEFQYSPGKEADLQFLKAKATGARSFFNAYTRRIESLKK